MPRRPADPPAAVPLYAQVQPGLEPVAADEITRDLGGQVKKTSRGTVVFTVGAVTPAVLQLRTTEDVFLLAWGSNTLTYRPADLPNFQRWTHRKPDWPGLFRLHHALRPKLKGKPTFRLVCQMQGEHAYKRAQARQALADGLAPHLPAGWFAADENAWLEVWLTIRGQTATCGVRLSDRTMRHRTYKDDHVLASLRPTVAAALVRLAGVGPGMTVIDPMCGAGTILAEAIMTAGRRRGDPVRVVGGDLDPNAVFVAGQNLQHVGPAGLVRWDSRRLPLADASVDRIVCNPPFGKQLSSPDEVPALYAAAAAEWHRVLKPGGRAVVLATEEEALKGPLRMHGWRQTGGLGVRVLGQPAGVSVWRMPAAGGSV
jgi:23S rRNA G2445 N2-methylase RlmL